MKWLVLSTLYPVDKNAQKVSKDREHENKLKFEGIDFPTPINQISKVDDKNDSTIKVHGYDGEIHPLHQTKMMIRIQLI